MIYTYPEQVTAKYTVKDAIDAARKIVHDRFSAKLKVINVSEPEDKKITLPQMNDITTKVVADNTPKFQSRK